MFIKLISIISAVFMSFNVFAQSCSAENEETGAYCSISCSTDTSANCSNGTGLNDPVCECSSKRNPIKWIYLFDKNNSNAKENKIVQTNMTTSINQSLSKYSFDLGQSCSTVVVGRKCDQSQSCYKCVRCGGNCGHERCEDVTERRCSQVQGALSVNGEIIVEEDPSVKIEAPNWDAIPNRFLGFRRNYLNCTNLEQSQTFRHSESIRVGQRVQKSKTLKTDNEIKVSVSAKGTVFGASAEYSVSKSVSITDTNEESNETVQNFEETIPIRIPEKTVIIADHTFVVRQPEIRFSGSVVIDAPVSANSSGIKLVSQVLTNKEDRRFNFEGSILDSIAASGDLKLKGRKATEQECAMDKNMRISSEFF